MNNATTATCALGAKMPTEMKERRVYQIHNSLDRMQEALDRQEALRNDLFYRLDTVMRPTEPRITGKDDIQGSDVPLCLRIDALTDRIAGNNDALKDILDRLEV